VSRYYNKSFFTIVSSVDRVLEQLAKEIGKQGANGKDRGRWEDNLSNKNHMRHSRRDGLVYMGLKPHACTGGIQNENKYLNRVQLRPEMSCGKDWLLGDGVEGQGDNETKC
jgi:hypothetical protein